MKYFIASLAIVLSFSGCFSPKKAKCEVKETYKLDWWTKNANMRVESFEVKVIESNLNLFNHTAKISYTISGTMKTNPGWEPEIGTVHVSEQYENRDSANMIAVHTFTPVMETHSNKKAKGGETKFRFTNEHTVSTYRWGQNKFRFVCGDFVTEVNLDQKK
jgi:hypothetical protein